MIKKLNVLLVDDEPRILRSLKAALKTNFNIIMANNAIEAQAIFTAKQPLIDVMITDEKMPEMTGTQLIKWVNVNAPSCKNLLLTGLPKINEIKSKLSDNDYSKCLSKPWDNQELIEAIYSADTQVTLIEKDIDDSHLKSSIIIHNGEAHSTRLSNEIEQRFIDIQDIFHTNTQDDLFNKIDKHTNINIVMINHDSGEINTVISKLIALKKKVILMVPPAFAMENSNDQVLNQATIMTKPISITRLEPIIKKIIIS